MHSTANCSVLKPCKLLASNSALPQKQSDKLAVQLQTQSQTHLSPSVRNTTIYTVCFTCSFKPAMDFEEPKLLNRHGETSLRCNDPCSLALTSSFLFPSSALRSTSPSRFQEPCCSVYKQTQTEWSWRKTSMSTDFIVLIPCKSF